MYGETLTPRERSILAVWTLKSTHRAERLEAAGVMPEELAALHTSGHLKTLPTGGVYLADGGTLVLGGKMRDRLEQLAQAMAVRGEELPSGPASPRLAAATVRHLPDPIPAAPAAKAPKAKPAKRRPERDPRFHYNAESEAWALAKYEEAMAAYRAGATYEPLHGCNLPNRVGRPEKPGIGDACVAWRKKILKGERSNLQAVVASHPSYARTLHPVTTVWTRGELAGQWVAASATEGADRAPIRVRCPSCQHPIRLTAWWEHGCEKAIVKRSEVLGDFHALTDGAAPPVYEEDAA